MRFTEYEPLIIKIRIRRNHLCRIEGANYAADNIQLIGTFLVAVFLIGIPYLTYLFTGNENNLREKNKR